MRYICPVTTPAAIRDGGERTTGALVATNPIVERLSDPILEQGKVCGTKHRFSYDCLH